MQNRPPFRNLIDSESFGEPSRRYFIDLKKTFSDDPFLQITRRDGYINYRRNQVIIFQKDLPFFIEALSMLLGRLSAGETSIN